MKKTFRDKGTEDIFNGKNSKDARTICPQILWKTVSRKLDQLDSASSLDDLKVPPGNLLEALSNHDSNQRKNTNTTHYQAFNRARKQRGPVNFTINI